jgi:hypothetical protein
MAYPAKLYPEEFHKSTQDINQALFQDAISTEKGTIE